MTTDTATYLYRALAADTELPVPAAVQRRIWSVAEASGDEALMVALIERDDAPADLLPKFAALTSAKARAAYLSRPGLDPAEVAAVLSREKRVTVLAALAESEATTPEVFDALADQMAHRRSKQLATALLRSARTTPAARLRALEFVDGNSGTFGWQQQKDIDRAVALLDDATADTVALTLSARVYPSLTGRDGLSVPARLRVVRDLVGPLCAGRRGNLLWTAKAGNQHVESLLERTDLQLEVMAALDAMLAATAGVRGGIDAGTAQALRQRLVHLSGGLLSRDLTAAEQDERIAVLGEASDRRTDADRLAELAAVAVTDRDQALAARLAVNVSTPESAAAALVSVLDNAATAASVYKAQAGAGGRDLFRIALVSTFPELLGGRAVARRDGGYAGTTVDATLSDFDDPAAAAQALTVALGEVACRDHRAGPQRSSALDALRKLVTDPAAVAADPVCVLPWRYAAEQSISGRTRHVEADETIALRVLALTTEYLADDATAWAVFEQLGQTFTGSVADLFAAVAAVATPADEQRAAVTA